MGIPQKRMPTSSPFIKGDTAKPRGIGQPEEKRFLAKSAKDAKVAEKEGGKGISTESTGGGTCLLGVHRVPVVNFIPLHQGGNADAEGN